MERLARSARESSRNCVRAWTLLGVPANRLSSPTRAAGSRVACRAADRQAAMMVGAPRKSRRGAVVMASLDSVVRPRSSLRVSGQCSRHRTLFRPQTQPQSQTQHTLRTPDPAQTQTQIQTRHTLPRTQCAEDVRQRGVGRRGGLGVAELGTSENAGAPAYRARPRARRLGTSWHSLAYVVPAGPLPAPLRDQSAEKAWATSAASSLNWPADGRPRSVHAGPSSVWTCLPSGSGTWRTTPVLEPAQPGTHDRSAPDTRSPSARS
jgi:hypothetical protein